MLYIKWSNTSKDLEHTTFGNVLKKKKISFSKKYY